MRILLILAVLLSSAGTHHGGRHPHPRPHATTK